MVVDDLRLEAAYDKNKTIQQEAEIVEPTERIVCKVGAYEPDKYWDGYSDQDKPMMTDAYGKDY